MILLFISKLKKRPRYLNDSPFLTVGTLLELIKCCSWNCRDRVENFFIPNVLHLSTLFASKPKWHHLVKQFINNRFLRLSLVTTAVSSANWNQ